MIIQHNFSLKNHNTFGIDAKANEFVAVHSIDELRQVLQENTNKKKQCLSYLINTFDKFFFSNIIFSFIILALINSSIVN
jgi:UDP-N-acetylenolpyruvoylglucosamine reductase